MRWKNFDEGASCYYITSTFTDWMKLFRSSRVLQIVREEITRATTECGAGTLAYVFMPEHLHLLTYLPEKDLIHRYCKLWRGRSARRIALYLEQETSFAPIPHGGGVLDAQAVLNRMATHAHGTARHAVWKEQPRSMVVWSKPVVMQKIEYIHNNPVKRGLTSHPADWPFSSWRFYEGDGKSLLPIADWPE